VIEKPYFLIDIFDSHQDQTDVLSVFLSDIEDFIGFTEYTNQISLCFEKESSSTNALGIIKTLYPKLQTASKTQKTENWNKVWEENFKPVIINDFAAIVAPHHQFVSTVKHCIVINPEMSFGTGHHETTSMMISYLSECNLNHKSILDFGCGTGILALLAEKEDASIIDAIDYDQLCVDSTIANITRNNCSKLNVKLGDAQSIDRQYDIILANVNRAALLLSCDKLSSSVLSKGELILSGILEADLDVINEAFNAHLSYLDHKQQGEWLAVRYSRK
tara:strand:+ start:6031 stop:6858 length:828 start_codon:yes stop_codon:yes gene_type:complete